MEIWKKEVQKVAVCTGSGKSLIKEVLKHQADVYVTGDADYHFAIDAVAQDVCIIDAGHYGTEYIFMDYMEKRASGTWRRTGNKENAGDSSF